ncbi:MAG: hypothetical protein KY476_09220 [Planctomycetes bacterium]|nr:hypothetical protein [Planctomycetota bacterium]
MASSAATPPPDAPVSGGQRAEYDPVFLHSRREAIVIFVVWLAGLVWAVPYCYVNGYVGNVEPESVATVWGIPAWLFWGIAVPWLAADLFTVWFCFWYMQDDDLGAAPEEESDHDDVGAAAREEAR